MASVEVNVPDDQIIELVERSQGLQRGDAVKTELLSLTGIPASANTPNSHVVTIALTYEFRLGEIEALTRP